MDSLLMLRVRHLSLSIFQRHNWTNVNKGKGVVTEITPMTLRRSELESPNSTEL